MCHATQGLTGQVGRDKVHFGHVLLTAVLPAINMRG